MTGLNKTVKRKVRAGHRQLVVILHPGENAVIEIREARKRSGVTVTVEGLYYMLAMRAVKPRAAKRGSQRKGAKR